MKQVVYRKFLIAGGNPTLLVWNSPRWRQREIINKYLGEVEQIGFVSIKNNSINLEMMGNELCINALIALSSTQPNKNGEISTTSIPSQIKYFNYNNSTTIVLALAVQSLNEIVLLPGIGYDCSNNEVTDIKRYLRKKTKQFNLPAFGLAAYRRNKIIPYVFVRKTNSLFAETACGSGSIALNTVKNYANIIQPTGRTISIKRQGYTFEISAQVTESKI